MSHKKKIYLFAAKCMAYAWLLQPEYDEDHDGWWESCYEDYRRLNSPHTFFAAVAMLRRMQGAAWSGKATDEFPLASVRETQDAIRAEGRKRDIQ